jgi:hypothetical protein
MKNILLFESYVNKIYEIRFDQHWIERTSLKDVRSRAVPYNSNFSYGFKITGFLDDKNNKIPKNSAIKSLNIDEDTINNYIGKAIHYVTNSKKLRDWMPNDRNPIQMVDLGRICFNNGNDKYYPIIKSGKGPGEPDQFYTEGDNIWGAVKDNDLGITVKYYSSDGSGMDRMYADFQRDTKFSANVFYQNSSWAYPYGEEFEMVVDLTDDNPVSIDSKLKEQSEGREWKMGPEEREEHVLAEPNYFALELKRIQLSPGLVIAIENRETGKKNLYQVSYISNAEDLYQTYLEDKKNKTDLLKSQPLIFVGVPVEEIVRFIGNKPINKISVIGSSIGKKITLNPGDFVYIKQQVRSSYGGVDDPNVRYKFKFVTSEPSILKRGSAQIALEYV